MLYVFCTWGSTYIKFNKIFLITTNFLFPVNLMFVPVFEQCLLTLANGVQKLEFLMFFTMLKFKFQL